MREFRIHFRAAGPGQVHLSALAQVWADLDQDVVGVYTPCNHPSVERSQLVEQGNLLQQFGFEALLFFPRHRDPRRLEIFITRCHGYLGEHYGLSQTGFGLARLWIFPLIFNLIEG